MRGALRLAMHRMLRCLALTTGWLLLSAHVGSNQVVFEGQAGGYPVRVMISPPGVVPAQVPITVRVLEGTPTRVTVRAAQWNLGTKGAPPAEEATLVTGDPGVWAHDLWIMTSSTYAVHVAVEGSAGAGTLIVPMQTSATRTLGMQRGMGAALSVMGALLVIGVLTIVGAATREGTVAPGATPGSERTKRARLAMATTAGVLALALLGGAKWWQAEERAYRRSMFKPIAMQGVVSTAGGARTLTIAITDSLWRANRYSPLMPDHGKLMHLFLVRADAGALAHLHPLRVHADTFTTPLPPLPGGRYLLFGDMLFQSGTQRTLVDTVEVAESAVAPAAPAATGDRDDAWRAVAPVPVGQAASLADGGALTLSIDGPSTVSAGRDLRLVATVRNADGSPAALEPYMGMGGHAMVMRADGGVFMHLHPMGTASTTAQAQLMRRERGDTATLDSAAVAAAMSAPEEAAGAMHATHDTHGSTGSGGVVAFPFAFPSAGDYRVFVQVKRGGVVETAAFTVTVTEAGTGR